MKDTNNENGARLLEVPPSAESNDSRDWSIEERNQLLLREREARLEAEVMRDANLALTQDLSLERILETLLDYLRRLVPFDSANVMLVESDSYFVTGAIRGYEDFMEDTSLAKANIFSPRTYPLLRQICETKQSLLVSDTKGEPRWQSVPGSEYIRNWIGVPLFAHNEIIGLYSLEKGRPNFFTPEHVRKAEVLAAQAATAIRNARLFRQVETYAAELELSVKEREREKSALRNAEKRFRDILDSVHEGVFQTTPEGRFMIANHALARMLGFDLPDELIRTRTDIAREQYVDPDKREEFKRLVDSQGFVRNFEHEAYRKDGSTIWISENVRAVRNESGVVLHYEGTAQDVTERRRAEKALRESEERYRELFENARDAIYVHDLSGRYTSVNRAAEQLLGFTREEILGKHFSNFVSPRDLKQVRTKPYRKLDEENETIYEVDMVTRSGQRVPVEIKSRLIYENGAAVGVQGTARDITDRKRAQETLRIYSQRLIQAQEAEREKIARELHDEIGQVLTAVRISLQSLQRSGGTNENVRPLGESITIIDGALGRVRELSIELRPLLLDDLGLSAALRWYVDRYAQRAGIIAEVLNGIEEDGRLPRELETACFRIAQEALTNVARHAQAGSVSVQLKRSREQILLTIIDDGVGFDLDKLRKEALAASTLGLRGMEERALAVGGHIEIDSGSGRGTRVRAIFPLKRR